MHIVATSFSPFSAFSDPREGGGREWFREEKGLSKLLLFRRLARFYYRHTPYGGHAQPHTWGRWVGRRRRQDGCFHYHHHYHHHHFDFILHLLLFYNIIIVELHLLLHSYCFLLPSTSSTCFSITHCSHPWQPASLLCLYTFFIPRATFSWCPPHKVLPSLIIDLIGQSLPLRVYKSTTTYRYTYNRAG